jgi:transcription initiation factor TFIIIB Brf1 subunit/transcription initiation factor TFIIB
VKNSKAGIILKYNPCSIHARKGIACEYYDKGRKCKKPLGSCNKFVYDLWYKDMLQTKSGYFYPKRIKYLETPGAIFFIYHVDKKMVTGEAIISNFVEHEDQFNYHFKSYHVYTNPIPLELLVIDPRLPRIARGGRWRFVYINSQVVDKIRQLSILNNEERKNTIPNYDFILSVNKTKRKRRIYKPKWKKQTNVIIQQLVKKDIPESLLIESEKIVEKSRRISYFKSKPIKETFFASLYLSYRLNKTPKTIDEISNLGLMKRNRLTKYYRALVRKLKIKVPPIRPVDLLQSKVYDLPIHIRQSSIRKAEIITQLFTKKAVAPSSLAALSLYVTCKDNSYRITQKQIGEKFNVSIVTMRNLYKQYKQHQKRLTYPNALDNTISD